MKRRPLYVFFHESMTAITTAWHSEMARDLVVAMDVAIVVSYNHEAGFVIAKVQFLNAFCLTILHLSNF